MIRVGEKLLQTLGCKKPMLIGTGVLIVGECLISLTFLPEILYVICCIIGYLFLVAAEYVPPSTIGNCKCTLKKVKLLQVVSF